MPINRILNIVKPERLRESTNKSSETLLTSTESDKGRVINSSAFRRLQQKAQVFPLDENAAVRTRLTHSIEVSQIGRYLVQKIIEKTQERASLSQDYNALAALVNTVETSCLIHDIGNPPFGHLGEAAIRNWFKQKKADNELNIKDDLCHFDGNPQGLRNISFLSGKDSYGLNLTATQILSTIKYPYSFEKESENPEKFGIFESQLDTYNRACQIVGWEPGKKFPLALLMEAADDISYCISDLEDGIENKVINELFLEGAIDFYPQIRTENPVERFIQFKTDLINELVDHVSDNFIFEIEPILAGNKVDLIKKDSDAERKIKIVKNIAKKHIYTHDSVEKIEIAGNSAISGILNHFEKIITLDRGSFELLLNKNRKEIGKRNLEFEARMFNRLPNSYITKYNSSKEEHEINARCHLIVDFISGMTDDFAISTYQLLHGMKVK